MYRWFYYHVARFLAAMLLLVGWCLAGPLWSCASICFAQGMAEERLQQLSLNPKIHFPERVLRQFRQGKTSSRVIIMVSDAASGADGRGQSGLDTAAQMLQSEQGRRQLRQSVNNAQERVLAALDAQEVRLTNRFSYLCGFSAEVTLQGLEQLAQHPHILSIEEDTILEAQLSQGIPLMNASAVRDIYSGSGLSVAVCDTGIDYTHPRLGNGAFPNSKVIGGYDTGENDPDPIDGIGHGTACAGIIAGEAVISGDYIGGVAQDAKLYALKITYTPTGWNAATSDMIEAWEWSITHQYDDPENPILIISTSFGSGYYTSQTICDDHSPTMTTAAANAKAAGITIFVSSGNYGYCDGLIWPACLSDVVSVGAVYDSAFGMNYPCIASQSCAQKYSTTSCSTGYYAMDNAAADMVPSYSNTASFLNLLAPANRATTTDIAGAEGYTTGDYTTTFGGTSAASPYAAGAGAVLQSAAKAITDSYLTPDEVRTLLMSSGDPVTDGKVAITTPRINLAAAVNSINNPPQDDLTPGLYQEDSTGISYNGTWTSWSGSGPLGGSLMYTSESGSSAEFRIEGTGLTIYRTLAPSRGTMEVCIDGSCQIVDNVNTEVVWAEPKSFDSLGSGTHTVTISSTSSNIIDLDAVEVLESPVLLPGGLLQEDVNGISYSGVWTSWCGSGPLGGCLIYTNDPDATVGFHFEGTWLTIYRTLSNSRGSMEVCVDGSCESINNFNENTVWAEPCIVDDLTDTVHEVEIRNTSVSGEYLDLDALEVSLGLAVGLHQEDADGISYSGTWTSYSGNEPHGGSLIYTNDPAASLEFSIGSAALTLYRTLAPSRGPMEVCIDGGCQTIDNYDASVIWTAPVTFDNLGSGTHAVTISNTSSAYIDLDAVGVLASSIVLAEGLHQEDVTGITYEGDWTSWSGSGPNGGSLIYTADPGAAVQFRFDGTALTLSRTLADSRGSMEVCIDAACQPIDNFNETVVWADPVTFDNLDSGTHTALLSNTSGSGLYLDLDLIEVSGGQAQGMQEETAAPVILRKAGDGTGTIVAGEQECGPECDEIVVPYLTDALMMVQALPAKDCIFTGWETAGGILIGDTLYANPGETVYAVFEIE